MDNLCRICLAVDVKLLSLNRTEQQCTLSEMFTYITNLSLEPDDGLPSSICATCKDQVVHCYEFKQKCINSYEALKSLAHKLKKEDDGAIEQIRIENVKSELDDVTDVQYLEDLSELSDDDFLPEPRKIESPVPTCRTAKKKDSLAHSKSAKLSKDEQMRLEYEKSCKKYVCTICSKKYTSLRSLKSHMKTSHSETEPYSCKTCKRTFGSEHDLNVHKSMHNKTDSGWKCNQCGKEFKEKPAIRRHLMRHMNNKRYACELCDKTFSEHCALKRHLRVHTGFAPEKLHQCAVCDKRFIDKRTLELHLRVHNGERPCACADCGKTFRSDRLLASHRRVHEQFKPYPCNYCDKRFRHESSRTTHHRTHTGEKPYVCSYCGKTFIQNSNLTLHLRVHTGFRPHKCETCGHSFTSSSSLKVHIRSHTGEKPYSCKVCGKKFARFDMKSHMRVHTGERPHQCPVCSRRFTKLASLTDHQRIHTGEKPFECNGCSQKFRTKNHLAKHITAHNKKRKCKPASKRIVEKEKTTLNKQIEKESKDGIIQVVESLEDTNKNMNTNDIIIKIEPLQGQQELILTDDCDIKNELVVINKADNAANYQHELCLGSSELTSNFLEGMDLVTVNEGDINISATTSNTLQGSTVSLYQVDQSLVQIHSESGSVTISKITSKVTTNF